jgi:hypothetical protein
MSNGFQHGLMIPMQPQPGNNSVTDGMGYHVHIGVYLLRCRGRLHGKASRSLEYQGVERN